LHPLIARASNALGWAGMASSRAQFAWDDTHAAFSGESTRDDALRAIDTAFAALEREKRTEGRLSDLADALDAFSEGAWPVAVALAQASISKHPSSDEACRPAQMARSWSELKHEYEAVRRGRSTDVISVVDANLTIVGWSAAVPNITGEALRHPAGERLVGDGIISRRVELRTPRDIEAARGPKGWRGPWVCYALCAASLRYALGPQEVPVVKSRSASKAPLLGRTRHWVLKLGRSLDWPKGRKGGGSAS
jgi:hypothetical protein